MARVSGPLFSMSASGTVGKTITYGTWKGRPYVREWFKPENPQAAKQVNVRTALTLLVAYWKTLSAAGQAEWETAAEGLGMSGFNLYMKHGMDEYISQIGSDTTPTSCSYTGVPPDEVWTWA